MHVATRHWRALPGGRVRCEVCPRSCTLREGQRGFCFVRACEGGAIVLTSWGRTSGLCVDPIEKKPLAHFLPGTAVLSFGTAGCNLACRYCQNWSISRSRRLETLAETARPDDIARAAVERGCRSVAFTYNDPVIFLEYAADVATACHARGLLTVAVTAGYVCPTPRAELFAGVDAANVDLKAFSDDFYRRQAGGRLAPVLDTLLWLRHESAVWLELTTLVIPGLNDAPAELEALSRWVAAELGPDVPLHFTAFHPDGRLLDVPPTPLATLHRARDAAREQGLHHVYIGNVRDREGSSTRCAACGSLLIAREGYRIAAWGLDARGRCGACGRRCAGVFEALPGRWRGGRAPTRVGE